MRNIDLDLQIILAKKSDLMDVFELSNNPVVRKNSFNQEKIFLKDHKGWFEEKINSKDSFFYIVRSKAGKFVGYTRFDKQNEDYVITIHLKKEFRGKGLGTYLIKRTSHTVLKKHKIDFICAYVKCTNKASLRSFEKVGYKVLDKKVIKNIKYFRLKLNGKDFSYSSPPR